VVDLPGDVTPEDAHGLSFWTCPRRCDAAKRGPGWLVAQSRGSVAGGDEEQRGGVGAEAEARQHTALRRRRSS
jgi:hypothetical protein